MSPTVRGRADTSLSLPGSACQVLSGVTLRSLPVHPGLPMPPGGTHLLPGRVVAVDGAGAGDERNAEVAPRGIEMHSQEHPKPAAVAAEEAGVQPHFRMSRGSQDGSIRCLPSLSIVQGSLTSRSRGFSSPPRWRSCRPLARSRRWASCLPRFSVLAVVIPTTGVFLRDLSWPPMGRFSWPPTPRSLAAASSY
jgi:hypothetical protein